MLVIIHPPTAGYKHAPDIIAARCTTISRRMQFMTSRIRDAKKFIFSNRMSKPAPREHLQSFPAYQIGMCMELP